jgi:predicted  nucleic acid-binding Zn-ribbon protein
MDTIETLRQDVKEGQISAERLVDLIADLCRKLQAANQRIEELEKQCGGTPTAKGLFQNNISN